MHLDVSARGLTESDILHSLDGSGSAAPRTGRFTGVDLGGVARLLQSNARVLDGAPGDSSRTDFTTLSGTLTFRNGVAHTDDQITRLDVRHNRCRVGQSILHVDFHIASKAQLEMAG